jgi:hypothetical protein
MEPTCQSCHSGTAKSNSGQIRYLSAFDGNGNERVPADNTFATNPDTPAGGISLYRFSVGHGGLQCSACHGSTHAEFPAAHRNDNIRNIQIQGHAGVMAECTACHVTVPATVSGGPHGMHPLGQSWVNSHHDQIQSVGVAACQACHGLDYRGTVLSRMQGDRTLQVGDAGTLSFYRGATIGCYTCHQGPRESDMNPAAAPAIGNVSAQTPAGIPVSMNLPVTLASGVTVRVISQPQNGTVGISNAVATYYPFDDFSGVDTFTFAAYNGAKNSALATGTVQVTSAPVVPVAPVITGNPASRTVLAGATVTFTGVATGTAPLRYQWLKNGAVISGATNAALTLASVTTAAAGSYQVRVSNAAGTVTSAAATLTVLNPARISGFTPTSGGVGTAVTISGSYFSGATAVTFNGVAAPFTVVSAGTLVAGVPAGATTGKIAVTTPANTAVSASNYNVGSTKVVPRISGFSPSSGAVGTVITVSGSNLGGAVAVNVGGSKAGYRVLAAGKLAVTVPYGAVTGKISVSTAGGTGASKGNFTVR